MAQMMGMNGMMKKMPKDMQRRMASMMKGVSAMRSTAKRGTKRRKR